MKVILEIFLVSLRWISHFKFIFFKKTINLKFLTELQRSLHRRIFDCGNFFLIYIVRNNVIIKGLYKGKQGQILTLVLLDVDVRYFFGQVIFKTVQ